MPERSYHHGNLRGALLDAAEKKLEATGSAGLSLRELARDVGVSHAAPRQHFNDKRSLLDALTLRGLERLGDRFAIALEPTGESFQERLTAFATAYVEFAQERPELLALTFARKDREDAPDLRVASAQAFALPSAMIDDAQRDGTIDGSDPDRVAMAVLVVLHGLAVTVRAGMIGDRPVGSVIAGTVQTLLDGLNANQKAHR
jgi:AcrR family transcriptional regulator